MTSNRKFDIIITGGGIAGFTAATILQKYFKKKTALVTGVHPADGEVPFDLFTASLYTGQMETESIARRIFDWITEGKATWERLPSIYERHFYPGRKINLSDNLAHYMDALKEGFPKERGNVDLIFRDIQHAANYTSYYLMKLVLPPILHGVSERFFASGKRYAGSSFEEYLSTMTENGRFKQLLSGQLQNLASCRESTAFIFQSMNMMDFLNGAFAPTGGPATVYRQLAEGYISAGGTLLEGTVSGVDASTNKINALHFIDNSGKEHHLKSKRFIWGLGITSLHEKVKNEKVRQRLVSFAGITEHMPHPVVYEVELNEKFRELNIKGEVFRFFPDEKVAPDEIPQCVSLYPVFSEVSGEQFPEKYIAVVFISGESVQQFFPSDKEIYDLKEYVTEMIKLYQPNLAAAIGEVRHKKPGRFGPNGYLNPFGTAMPSASRARGRMRKNPWKLSNVYLTDADLFIPGAVGSVMSGVTTLGMVMGPFPFFKFFRYLKRESKKVVKIKIKPLKYKK